MVLSVTEFIGHLHPLLVHLPIGILFMACLFLWLSRKDQFAYLKPAVHVILLCGMLSAIATCITGYILSGSGDYDENLVQLHQWMGIGVAVISIFVYYVNSRNTFSKWQTPFTILLGILIIITGHLGGSLTHGSDYLTKPLENLSGDDTIPILKRKPIPDIQLALVYGDVMEPIFQSKCYNCHSALKQKGKLRLDKPEMIIKGGKNGKVIISGNSAESELVKRVLSAREDEHHMPPKEKAQLNEKEKTLLQWWVNQGADFTKQVKDIPQPEKIKPLLAGLQNVTEEKKSPSLIPSANIEKADEKAIQRLKDKGIVVVPVSQNSNYLSVNFITNPDFSDRDIPLLLPLTKQLVWLKIGHTAITDSALTMLSNCLNLTELHLDHTGITDKGLENLKSLQNLQVLNLVGTKVTAAGVMHLRSLKKLQSIYLFQSDVDKKDWASLLKAFPKSVLDSGGYKLKYIESDTQIVKPPPVRN